MTALRGNRILFLYALAIVVGLLAWIGPSAHAGREVACHDPWVSETVEAATGNVPVDHVCDVRLYNNGSWQTKSELQGYVNGVMGTCGTDQAHKNLTQAVIEVTGVRPEGAVCEQSMYEASYNNSCQSGCEGIAWTHYKTGAGFEETPAFNAVYQTLETCANPVLTQALIQEGERLPGTANSQFEYWGHLGSQEQGQCSGTLYDHYGWYSYQRLVELVDARMDATACSNTQIDLAFTEMTEGWHPLASECSAGRYVAGNWANFNDLKLAVGASFRCDDPWIGEIYELDFHRIAHGRSQMGECNPILYGNGTWSGSSLQDQYQNLESLMGATQSSLGSVDWSFVGTSGDMQVTLPPSLGGGQEVVEGGEVRFANPPSGMISTGSGDIISKGGGSVIAAGGGNVLSPGNGSIEVEEGAMIISTGGGSVIAAGGGNLISDKGLGLTGQAGGNVIAAGGGN